MFLKTSLLLSESSESILTNSGDFAAFSFVESVSLNSLTGYCSSSSLPEPSESVTANSGDFGAFLNYFCICFTTGFSVTVSSICTMQPTEGL